MLRCRQQDTYLSGVMIIDRGKSVWNMYVNICYLFRYVQNQFVFSYSSGCKRMHWRYILNRKEKLYCFNIVVKLSLENGKKYG